MGNIYEEMQEKIIQGCSSFLNKIESISFDKKKAFNLIENAKNISLKSKKDNLYVEIMILNNYVFGFMIAQKHVNSEIIEILNDINLKCNEYKQFCIKTK